MTIGAVIIGQHEEALLPKCLESLKGLDEIYFCYTGDPNDKEDKTIEIAKKHNAKISYFRWCDHFAKARNFVKSQAKTDWLLSIDCDEHLESVDNLRKAVEEAEKQKVLTVDCKLVGESAAQSFFYPRLMKNVPEVFWEGAIHNSVSIIGSKIGNVKIILGYSPAHHTDPNRALRILEKEYQASKRGEQPFSPRTMYYLGREYFYKGKFRKSIACFKKYVKISRFLSEKADAYLIMGRAYRAIKKPDEAREACAMALIINARFKEAILFMAQMSWPHNAVQWQRMAETANNENVLFIRET